MANPVHMVGTTPFKLKLGREVHTRCGLIATPLTSHESGVYKMASLSGGDFRCTTRVATVTCRKCTNLLNVGMIHAREAS